MRSHTVEPWRVGPLRWEFEWESAMKVKLSSAVAVAAAIMCSAGYASAGTYGSVSVKFVSVSPSLTVNVNTPYRSGSFNSGQMNWTTNGGGGWNPASGFAPGPSTFSTFCIDLVQNVSTNLVTYGINDLGVAPRPNAAPNPTGMGGTNWGSSTIKKDSIISELYKEHYASLSVGTAADKNVANAAFQAVIWKILYETESTKIKLIDEGLSKFTVGGGSASAFKTKANSFLATLGDGYAAGLSGLFSMTSPDLNSTNGNAQDQVFYRPPLDPAPLPIPLPAASVAGLVIMGMIGAKRAMRS